MTYRAHPAEERRTRRSTKLVGGAGAQRSSTPAASLRHPGVLHRDIITALAHGPLDRPVGLADVDEHESESTGSL